MSLSQLNAEISIKFICSDIYFYGIIDKLHCFIYFLSLQDTHFKHTLRCNWKKVNNLFSCPHHQASASLLLVKRSICESKSLGYQAEIRSTLL